MVPIFYFNWCVGHAVLSGAIEQDQSVRDQLAAVLTNVGGSVGVMSHLFDWSFWQALLTSLGSILPELLAGSLMVATVSGGAGYVLTLRGVTRYRLHRERRHAAPETIVLERERVVSYADGEAVVFFKPGTLSALDKRRIDDSCDVGATGIFDARLDGRKLTFRPDGDRFVDNETGTVWNILGQAIDGHLAGSQLTDIVHGNHFWFAWGVFKPDTLVYRGMV